MLRLLERKMDALSLASVRYSSSVRFLSRRSSSVMAMVGGQRVGCVPVTAIELLVGLFRNAIEQDGRKPFSREGSTNHSNNVCTERVVIVYAQTSTR